MSENQNQLPVHYTSAYLADELSNSVQITLAQFSDAGAASAASTVTVASRALPGSSNQCVAHAPERDTTLDEVRDSKLGTWLFVSVVIFVTTMCSVPSFVAHSKQLPADTNRSAFTAGGGTAATTAKAEDKTFAVPDAPVSLSDVDSSAAQQNGTSSGAHRTVASDSNETGTRENSRRLTHNDNHTARGNAGNSGSGGGMLVPPPPPTPCVLPPESGIFPMKPGQQYAALQQQLEQAQMQASLKSHNQAADRDNTPQQPTSASGRTEATQDAALVDADQELQAAVKSSLHTVGEWTR